MVWKVTSREDDGMGVFDLYQPSSLHENLHFVSWSCGLGIHPVLTIFGAPVFLRVKLEYRILSFFHSVPWLTYTLTFICKKTFLAEFKWNDILLSVWILLKLLCFYSYVTVSSWWCKVLVNIWSYIPQGFFQTLVGKWFGCVLGVLENTDFQAIQKPFLTTLLTSPWLAGFSLQGWLDWSHLELLLEHLAFLVRSRHLLLQILPMLQLTATP